MNRAIQSLLIVVLLAGCARVDRAFYQPDGKVYGTPEGDGLGYEEVRFRSEDGTALSGWFVPATTRALGTVIHYHGNAQNMTAHYGFVSWLPRNGFNVFVFDYRGYGASEGRPTREGVYQDSVAAMRYVKSREDIDQGRVVVLGQSLGGANAIAALGNNDFEGVAGVVIDSAFSSYEDVAQDHVGFLVKPLAGLLVRDKYCPADAVGRISPIPILIIHGRSDGVVPYYHGERLYEKAGEPKRLWALPNAGHTEALGRYRDEVAPQLLELMRGWVGGDSGQEGK